MKWLLAILLLTACYYAAPQLSLDSVQPDKEYVAVQSFKDTGFAGQGAQEWKQNFTVRQEVARDDLLTMSAVLAEAKQYEYQDQIFVNSFTNCGLHAKAPVLSVIICTKDNKVIFYERQETLGNHQKRTLTWELVGEEMNLQDCGRSTYCKILQKAKDYNSNTCNNLDYFSEECKSI